jgi:N6-adenosine-specific RNA methylase IME4
LALPNAVLALWATVPLGDEPFILMREWGFTFKTTFFWIKTGRLGMGHYFRGDVEMLLFGTRGKVRPFRMRSQRNYHMHPTLKQHSAKPAWFRTLIEESTFDVSGKRLELFARERAAGWDATGLELDGFDIRKLRVAR